MPVILLFLNNISGLFRCLFGYWRLLLAPMEVLGQVWHFETVVLMLILGIINGLENLIDVEMVN